MTIAERTPTLDERRGMAWWNGLSEDARGEWLRQSGGTTAADAWACYKAGVPVSIYLDRDECGDPRIVANPNTPRRNDPMARHVRRVLEKL